MKVRISSSRKTSATAPRSSTPRAQTNPLKKKHQKLRNDPDFYFQVFESLSDYAVFTVDLYGTISSWNNGAKHILGYTSEEVIGRNADIFFTKDDRKHKRHNIELETAAKYGKARDERWHVKKDKSQFWGFGLVFPLFNEEGKHVGFTKVMRDLTEHDLLHKELQKYKDIFQYTKLGIVIGSADRKNI